MISYKTRITYVSPFIEKGRWLKHDAFYLKAAEASEEAQSHYFIVHGERIARTDDPSFFSIWRFRAAFCTYAFSALDQPGSNDIVTIHDNTNSVTYSKIANHPDCGDVEVTQNVPFEIYIKNRPKAIEFAIFENSSLLCYEEY